MIDDPDNEVDGKRAGFRAALKAASVIKASSLMDMKGGRKVGGVRALADLLSITSSAVSSWAGEIPLARVVQVEAATGVPRHVLRPDCWSAPKAVTEETGVAV